MVAAKPSEAFPPPAGDELYRKRVTRLLFSLAAFTLVAVVITPSVYRYIHGKPSEGHTQATGMIVPADGDCEGLRIVSAGKDKIIIVPKLCHLLPSAPVPGG